MSFEKRLAFGKFGESLIANFFKNRLGYAVLPIYEEELKSDKGPRILTSSRRLITPDILVFRKTENKKAYWIEAKHKSAFSWHRNTGKWVTGIDLHLYRDYLRIAELSPWPIWLLFLHQEGAAKDTPPGMVSPTGLFGNELIYLSEHENHRHDNWGKSGMVYWAHETLREIASLKMVYQYSQERNSDDER